MFLMYVTKLGIIKGEFMAKKCQEKVWYWKFGEECRAQNAKVTEDESMNAKYITYFRRIIV